MKGPRDHSVTSCFIAEETESKEVKLVLYGVKWTLTLTLKGTPQQLLGGKGQTMQEQPFFFQCLWLEHTDIWV